MLRPVLLAPVVLAGAAILLAQTPAEEPSTAGEHIYAANCASCHGENRQGGAGPALTQALIASRTDEQLGDTIRNGRPDAGMPPFRDVLSDAQRTEVIGFLRHDASTGPSQSLPPAADPAGMVVRTARQTVRLEVVAAGLDTPWAVAFLPGGRKLVSERPGHLRIIDRNGRLRPEPVIGTPTPWVRQDGGYLDIAVHPDYRRNGWIYLSYSEVLPGHAVTAAEAATPRPGAARVNAPSMTVIARGRIDKRGHWTDNQLIYRAPSSFYTRDVTHYGSRFLFDGRGHLFFSLGERGDMTQAQRLDSPLGKIHRINDDGSTPADNPFVHRPGAIPTIWSYGHRNPEGLAIDPATGLMWESEHGPLGGDEINIIEKGRNYGWGVVSMGVQPGIDKREAPGMVPPVTFYTPSIAPSGIAFYTGNRYPGWKNDLFVAALAGQQLRRVEVNGRAIDGQEIILQHLGRTRAVYTGPDGLLYVLVHRIVRGGATPPQGWLLRLQPQG